MQYKLQELATVRHTIHILAAITRFRGGLYICWSWKKGNWFIVRGWSILYKLCYQEHSERYCCNASLRTHVTHLFWNRKWMTSDFTSHTHVLSPIQVFQPGGYSQHPAAIQPHHFGEMPGGAASSGWLLIQMCIPQLGLETPLDYRALPLLNKNSCCSKHEATIRMNGMEGILKSNRRVGKEFNITKGKYSLLSLSLTSSGKYPRIDLIW